jgi:hypothetical protein
MRGGSLGRVRCGSVASPRNKDHRNRRPTFEPRKAEEEPRVNRGERKLALLQLVRMITL